MTWLIALVSVFALLTLVVAWMPKGHASAGMADGRLSACPGTPNCVCSEYSDGDAYIAPLSFDAATEDAWQNARQAILSAGGNIQAEDDGYLWASFTTRWLRFVDDVELRMDANSHRIHIRSASRVGRSDFGVNRKRVEHIRSLFNTQPSTVHDR